MRLVAVDRKREAPARGAIVEPGPAGQVEGQRGSRARRDVRLPALARRRAAGPHRPRQRPDHAERGRGGRLEAGKDSATICTSRTARCWGIFATKSATTIGTAWSPGRRGWRNFAKLFGDERQDYAAALKRNYEQGPPADWADHHISSYASVHPWEDWAESWAHYLHVVDSLDTALRFGLRGEDVEAAVEPFHRRRPLRSKRSGRQASHPAHQLLGATDHGAQRTGAEHGPARLLPLCHVAPVLRKMHFIQMIVKETRRGSSLI